MLSNCLGTLLLCNTLYQTNNLPYCCFQLFSSLRLRLRWGGGWRTIDLRHSLTTSTHFLKALLTVVRPPMYWDESIQCFAWYSQYMGGLKWSEVWPIKTQNISFELYLPIWWAMPLKACLTAIRAFLKRVTGSRGENPFRQHHHHLVHVWPDGQRWKTLWISN